MSPETVVYDDGRVKARLEVTTATVRMGMKRQRLRLDGSNWTIAQEKPDIDEALLRQFSWPDMMGATADYQVEMDGKTFSNAGEPLTVEVYLELPDALSIEWDAAVYRQNPTWLKQSEEPAGKKAPQPPSTGG